MDGRPRADCVARREGEKSRLSFMPATTASSSRTSADGLLPRQALFPTPVRGIFLP